MNKEFFIQNGIIYKTDEPTLNTNNRAFLYGDGFFESIYAFNSNIPFLKYHLTRIKKAFNVFDFEEISIFNNLDDLTQLILFLAHKNKLYKAFRIRVTFFRYPGGLYNPLSKKANFTIHTSKLDFDKLYFNENGLKVDLFDLIKKDFSIISPFKTICPQSVLAMNYANMNNLDDVIFLNYKNNIVETSNSNIFISINNELFTPSINEGCVEGIMRQIIINIANSLNLKIHETEIKIDFLNSAQEIILTNSISGIRYVSAFRTKRYMNFTTKKLFNELSQTFFK